MQIDNSIKKADNSEIERLITTTASQTEILLACIFGKEDANKAFNESITLNLYGDLNIESVQKALNTLISRHESLRAAFSPDAKYMFIFKDIEVPLDYRDFSNLKIENQSAELEKLKRKHTSESFDLVWGPLLRFSLVKLNEKSYSLVFTAHHVICDGWSTGIILQEISKLYSEYSKGVPSNLKQPELYSHYSQYVAELHSSKAYDSVQEFWVNQYAYSIPELNLPTDRPRPKLRTFACNRLDFDLKSNLYSGLKLLAKQERISLVTICLAAFDVLIHKVTNQKDFIIGLPAAGQSESLKLNLVGHCVNLLPLKTNIDPELSFIEYLNGRNEYLLDAYEYQQLTFGKLLQLLPIQRDNSKIPLVPVIFNIDMGMSQGVHFEGLEFSLQNNSRQFENFELFVNATDENDILTFEWSYNVGLFDSETIQKMMASFETLIKSFIDSPNTPINQFLKKEKAVLTAESKDSAELKDDRLVVDMILDACENYKNHVALESDFQTIQYGDIPERINHFAWQLNNAGVKENDVVAISLPRSPEMVYALLALLHMGCSYVPLDPSYPENRLEYMLGDSNAAFLITTEKLSQKIPPTNQVLLIEDLLKGEGQSHSKKYPKKSKKERIAYIIYTSGSTGKPKGVVVTQENLMNFLRSMSQNPGISESDRLLSITTISFDIAGLELYLPLINGATLVLAHDDVSKDGRLLMTNIEDKNISYLQATPTSWQMLIDAGWKKKLAIKALSGGERLTKELATKILGVCDELYNMYGPTETTIWSTVKKIDKNDGLITIGKPIANTQIYILDEQNHPLEVGIEGQIAIGGLGVAKGYLNRPELTNERFIKGNGFNVTDTPIYLTGDLGKILPSGELVYIGRMDQQVKIRGHRIELSEIEYEICSLPGIQNSTVIASDGKLYAFIKGGQKIANLKPESLSSELRKKLPLHMIPQTYQSIEEFPTTLNGKIDRNALKKLIIQSQSQIKEKRFTAPRTRTEHLVAETWKSALEKEQIDIFSNFFDLGGHSLIALQIVTEIESKTSERIPISAFFEHPTIEKLARLIEDDTIMLTWDSLVPIKPKGSKTPLYIIHGAGLNVMIFQALAKNMDDEQPVFGIQAKGLNGIDKPLETVEEIAAYYIETIKKCNPQGPYSLAGYSYGGIIAYEMTQQLIREGKRVETLGLFDTYADLEYKYKNPTFKKIAKVRFNFLKVTHILWEMRRKEYFIYRVKDFSNDVKDLFKKLKYGNKRFHELKYNQSYELDKSNLKAMGKYYLKPIEKKIDLFRAQEAPHYVPDHQFLGWKPFATKGVDVHEIPGNHYEIFSKPHDKISSEILQSVLDKNSNDT